ncbi:Clp protease N-terminal domain-containing protein, partial [Armatimonas sp.]
DAEHLLLGLLQEQENSACHLLQRLSVSPTHLRRR